MFNLPAAASTFHAVGFVSWYLILLLFSRRNKADERVLRWVHFLMVVLYGAAIFIPGDQVLAAVISGIATVSLCLLNRGAILLPIFFMGLFVVLLFLDIKYFLVYPLVAAGAGALAGLTTIYFRRRDTPEAGLAK